MGFEALSAKLTSKVFAQLGEPATFTPAGGASIATRAELDENHPVVGELGHIVDSRPVISLPKADVGRPRSGTVVVLGRTFKLDQPVDYSEREGQNADDGHVVRYYVREVTP